MQYIKRCRYFTFNIYDVGNLPYCTQSTSVTARYSGQLHRAEHCTSVFRSALTHTTHCTASYLTLINISKQSLQNNNKTAECDPNQIQELGQYNYVYAKYVRTPTATRNGQYE